VRTRRFDRVQRGLWGAALAHIVELHHPGFSLQAGGYASTFTALEGTFSAVLLVTAVLLMGLANRTRLGFFCESAVAIQAVGELLILLCTLALLNFRRFPTGWYPTAVTVSPDGASLYITNAKGMGGDYAFQG
jgi:hypothetical protein